MIKFMIMNLLICAASLFGNFVYSIFVLPMFGREERGPGPFAAFVIAWLMFSELAVIAYVVLAS